MGLLFPLLFLFSGCIHYWGYEPASLEDALTLLEVPFTERIVTESQIYELHTRQAAKESAIDSKKGNEKTDSLKSTDEINDKQIEAKSVSRASSINSNNKRKESEYKSTLGNLYIGTNLYYKSDHSPFGIVTNLARGKVAVLKLDSLYQIWYERSFITSNYDTK